MSSIQDLEGKIEHLDKRVAILERGFLKEIWMRENPPAFKYGDTFELNEQTTMKVLSVKCDDELTYYPHFRWIYHVDTGTGYGLLSEDTLKSYRS